MSAPDPHFEPRPGLPAPLPAGEALLWQGSPDAATLARDAYKIRWITGYMLLLALWRGGAAWADAGSSGALATLIPYLVLALAAWGVIRLLAWAQARATIYSITSARIILRIGAALPITYTIPFSRIESAALSSTTASGTGTLAFATTGNTRLSWAVLWPHVRPWHLRVPQPAFRAIPDAARAGRIFADAAQAKLNEPRINLANPAGTLVAAE